MSDTPRSHTDILGVTPSDVSVLGPELLALVTLCTHSIRSRKLTRPPS